MRRMTIINSGEVRGAPRWKDPWLCPSTQLLSPLVTPSSVPNTQTTVAESRLLGRWVQGTVSESFLVTVTPASSKYHSLLKTPDRGWIRDSWPAEGWGMNLLSVSSEVRSLVLFSFDSVYVAVVGGDQDQLDPRGRLRTLGESVESLCSDGRGNILHLKQTHHLLTLSSEQGLLCKQNKVRALGVSGVGSVRGGRSTGRKKGRRRHTPTDRTECHFLANRERSAFSPCSQRCTGFTWRGRNPPFPALGWSSDGPGAEAQTV